VEAQRAVLAQSDWRLAQRAVQAPAKALVQDTFYSQGEGVQAGAPVVSLLPPAAVKLRSSASAAPLKSCRISVAISPAVFPGGFSFNQYLVVDDQPLLFHTGPRKMFPLVREKIEKVIPVSQLRYLAFSHYEADECGALPDFLALAPQARPACSSVASEAFRQRLDYFSHSEHAPALMEKLAQLNPGVLACMHGSAWHGDGAGMLRELSRALMH
jgi:hypothetical protein